MEPGVGRQGWAVMVPLMDSQIWKAKSGLSPKSSHCATPHERRGPWFCRVEASYLSHYGSLRCIVILMRLKVKSGSKEMIDRLKALQCNKDSRGFVPTSTLVMIRLLQVLGKQRLTRHWMKCFKFQSYIDASPFSDRYAASSLDGFLGA